MYSIYLLARDLVNLVVIIYNILFSPRKNNIFSPILKHYKLEVKKLSMSLPNRQSGFQQNNLDK